MDFSFNLMLVRIWFIEVFRWLIGWCKHFQIFANSFVVELRYDHIQLWTTFQNITKLVWVLNILMRMEFQSNYGAYNIHLICLNVGFGERPSHLTNMIFLPIHWHFKCHHEISNANMNKNNYSPNFRQRVSNQSQCNSWQHQALEGGLPLI